MVLVSVVATGDAPWPSATGLPRARRSIRRRCSLRTLTADGSFMVGDRDQRRRLDSETHHGDRRGSRRAVDHRRSPDRATEMARPTSVIATGMSRWRFGDRAAAWSVDRLGHGRHLRHADRGRRLTAGGPWANDAYRTPRPTNSRSPRPWHRRSVDAAPAEHRGRPVPSAFLAALLLPAYAALARPHGVAR